MSVYYSDDYVTLYHGDCREVTEWLAADVLVTDPPYGIGWALPAYLTRGRTSGQWPTPHEGILNDEDTSARDEVLAMWGDRPALVFGSSERPPPAHTRRTLVWQKPADSGLFGSTIWRKDWEPIFMVGKWPQIPASASSIITTAHGSHREYAQGIHPHAKPIDTLQKLIVKCPPGTVADPFAGSGSTLVAAKRLGRKAIGVEVDERYCEIAAKRLAQGVLDFGTGERTMLTKLTALAFAVALLAGCGSNEQAPAPTFGSHEVDEFYVIHPPTGPSITVWCEGSAAFLMTDSGSLTVVDGRCDHGLPFPTAWNLWGE